MNEAYQEALTAYQLGEIPVGAVVTYKGRIIASTGNRIERDQDPTAHAELLAIKAATRVLGNWRLNECDLYVTLEPCIMCLGALINARIGRLIFGSGDSLKGGLDLVRYSGKKDLLRNIEVYENIMEEECAELLNKFFQERRRTTSDQRYNKTIRDP